ncbi:MAG: FAD-dependent oxidoreductase [Phycisphaerales bacterium]|nr:FAD-dependent oxidoreductase [Phycisphaerales bacterium]
MIQHETYDCIVVGGGPAGSTVGTLLADYGHRVLLLEKAIFPRHQIGESLMPHTYWTFKRLGMLDKLKASRHTVKESVQFFSANGKASQPYYFPDHNPHECSYTWQVKRDEFDRMMLDNAREHGVEVHQNALVKRVLFDGSRATGVRAVVGDRSIEIRCSVVIDATGQATMLSGQLGLVEPDPGMRHGAIFSYYHGAVRDSGRDAGAILVVRTPDHNGWFWFIPLLDDVTSVGVVGSPEYLFTNRGNDPMATLEVEIERCPILKSRLAPATRIAEARVRRDFSYHARRIAGDGWVLVGDAFGFIDPVYSSGVMLALKGGELAADTIHAALRDGDVCESRLAAYGSTLVQGMEMVRRLVHAFYDPSFSFGQFLRRFPDYRDYVARVLIGDVFNDEVGRMFDAMAEYTAFLPPITLEQGAAR